MRRVCAFGMLPLRVCFLALSVRRASSRIAPAMVSGERVSLRDRQGTVFLRNTQRSERIDVARVERDMRTLLRALDCAHYDVSVWLSSDATVRRHNAQFRGKRRSTDILSFPFHELPRAGALDAIDEEVSTQLNQPDSGLDPVDREAFLEANLQLGDLLLSVPYVQRQCVRDERAAEAAAASLTADRGVSGAMSRVFTVQERLPLLFVHGVLHLLGYDHETNDDYELMVRREEELLRELRMTPVSIP